MKKFLAVFDGFNMSKSTLNYAIQLTQAADTIDPLSLTNLPQLHGNADH